MVAGRRAGSRCEWRVGTPRLRPRCHGQGKRGTPRLEQACIHVGPAGCPGQGRPPWVIVARCSPLKARCWGDRPNFDAAPPVPAAPYDPVVVWLWHSDRLGPRGHEPPRVIPPRPRMATRSTQIPRLGHTISVLATPRPRRADPPYGAARAAASRCAPCESLSCTEAARYSATYALRRVRGASARPLRSRRPQSVLWVIGPAV